MKNGGLYQNMAGFDIQNSGISIGQHPVGFTPVGKGGLASASVSTIQAQPGTTPNHVRIANDWHKNVKR